MANKFVELYMNSQSGQKKTESQGQTALSSYGQKKDQKPDSSAYLSPFGVHVLDQKFREIVVTLDKANQAAGGKNNVLQDAYDAVNGYRQTVVQSHSLLGDQGDPLKVGEDSLKQNVQKRIWDYTYAGKTGQEYAALLQGTGYQTPGQIEKKNQQNVIERARALGAQQADTDALEAKAKEYDALYRYPDRFADNSGTMGSQAKQGREMQAVKGAEAMESGAPDGWTDQDWAMYRKYGAKLQEAEDAIRQSANLSYEAADKALEGQPGYSFAKAHPGDLTGYANTFANINGILNKIAAGGPESLTEQEAEVYSYALDVINEKMGGKFAQDLTAGEREALTRWGEENAANLSSMNGLYSAYAPTEEQQYLLDRYRDTLEGARQYAEEAAGTSEEQKAKDNLYFVEKRTKFAEVPTVGNYAEDKKPQENFKSGNGELDRDYRIISSPTVADQYLALKGHNAGAVKLAQYGTEDEKGIFYALANRGQYDEALEYLEYMQYALNERRAKGLNEAVGNVVDSGWGGAAAATVLTEPLSLIRGAGALDLYAQKLGQAFGSGKPLDYNSAWQLPGQLTDTARGRTMENYDWIINLFGRDVDLFDKAYGVLTSGADSFLTGKIGSVLGWSTKSAANIAGIILGSSAAQSTMLDIHDRGGDDTQVLIGGTLAGVAEDLFESLSIEKLLKDLDGVGYRNFPERVKNVLREAVINFSEEFNTETADILLDYMIMGDKGDYQTRRDEYEQLGLSPEDAKRKAVSDMIWRAIDAGVDGALMGAGFGEIANVTANVSTSGMDKRTGAFLKTDLRGSLKTMAEQFNGTKALADKYDPAKASNRQTGELLREVVKNLSTQDRSILIDRAAADFRDEGISEDAGRAITLMMMGVELTESQVQAIAKDDAAMREITRIMGADETKQGETAQPGKDAAKTQPANQAAGLGENEPDIPLPGFEPAKDAQAQPMQPEGKTEAASEPAKPVQKETNIPAAKMNTAAKDAAAQAMQPEGKTEAASEPAKPVQKEANVPSPDMGTAAKDAQAQAMQPEGKTEPANEPAKPVQQEINIPSPDIGKAAEGRGAETASAGPDAAQDAQNGGTGTTEPVKQEAPKTRPQAEKTALFTGDRAEKEAAPAGGNRKTITEISVDRDSGAVEAVLEDGERVALEDAGLTEDEQKVAMGAANLPKPAQIAMTNAYRKGQDARDYIRGFRALYQQIADGANPDKARSLYGEKLSEEQKEAAIRAGQEAYQEKQDQQKSNTEQTAREMANRGINFPVLESDNQQGSGVYLGTVERTPSDTAVAQLMVIDRLAKQYGIQVRVWDTMQANGSHPTGSNLVNVALDAEGGMLGRTVSHELFHYITDWSQEAGGKLRKYILDNLRGKQGYDFDARRQQIMDRYKDNFGQELTPDQAEEEMAAEGMLDVIATEGNLAALYKETGDRTLMEKIRDWLKNLVDRLKKAMDDLAWNHPEVRALKDDADYFQGLLDRFTEALEQAAANARAAQTGLFTEAKADPDVQSYLEGINKAVTLEDARTEAEALASKLFLRAEADWIGQHQDQYEQGFEKFKNALRRYAQGGVSMQKAFQDEGIDAPPQGMFSVLAYAGRQLASAEQAAENARYSVREDAARDAEYMRAVENGDMEAAQRITDEAAENAGFETETAYHGTKDFGFTAFDLNKGGETIFVAYNPDISSTYGTDLEVKDIGVKKTKEEVIKAYEGYTDKEAENAVIEYINQYPQQVGGMMEIYDSDYAEEGDVRAISKKEYMNDIMGTIAILKNKAINEKENRLLDRIERLCEISGSLDEESYNTERKIIWDELDRGDYFSSDETFYSNVSILLQIMGRAMLAKNRIIELSGNFGQPAYDSWENWAYKISKAGTGIYKLYTRPGNQLTVDAKDAWWNQIIPEWEKGDKYWTPRDIAAYAKEKGYNSVRINNVEDSGDPQDGAHGDIGIFFNPEDVKSADPVTYDDAGQVIPPSRRFDTGEQDIRYSVREEEEKNQEYMLAIEGGDEKVVQRMVDQEARKKGFSTETAYHGTDAFGFTVFDMDQSQGQIFVAYNPDIAKTYGSGLEKEKIGRLYSQEMLDSMDEKEREKAVKYYYEDRGFNHFEVKAFSAEEFKKKVKEDIAQLNRLAKGDPEKERVMRSIEDYLDNGHTVSEEEERRIRLAAYKLLGEGEFGENMGQFINYTWNAAKTDNDKIGIKAYGRWAYESWENLSRKLMERRTNRQGIYSLYTKPENQLVVEGYNAAWNSIRVPWDDRSYGYWTTRMIADYAKKNGYSSVRINNIYDHGGRWGDTEAGFGDIGIFFNGEDVKSADPITYDENGNVIPLSERFNTEEKDIRFSVREPVEESGDLIAVHNLNAAKLEDALELGGLPFISVAVTKKDMGHSDYGDISLLFDKNSIDPKADRRNHVYSRDAWTNRRPSVDVQINEKQALKLRDRLNKIHKGMKGSLRTDLWRFIEKLYYESMEAGSESLIEKAANNPGMMAAYLISNGETVEPVMKTVADKPTWNTDNEDLYIDMFTAAGIGSREELEEIRKNTAKDNYNKYKDALENVEGLKGKKAFYIGISLGDMARYFLNERTGESTVEDESAMRQSVIDRTDKAAFQKWLEDTLSGVVGEKGIRKDTDPYTSAGNRKSFWQTHSRYTLENIVKEMNRTAGKASEKTLGVGFGKIAGASAKEFKSINEIRQNKGMLQENTEETAQRVKEASDALFEVVQTLAKTKSYSDNPYTNNDIAGEILMDAVLSTNTKAGFEQAIRKDYPNASQETIDKAYDLIQEARNLPTDYFEAKLNRAETFDAVRLAVLPESLKQRFEQRLLDAGVQEVKTYPDKDEAARREAINSRPDVRFSQREDGEDRQADADIRDLQEDPDFYAQAMTDEETAQAVRLFAKIYRNLENASNYLVGKVTEREDWRTRKSELARRLITETGSRMKLSEVENWIGRLFESLDRGGYNVGESLMYARELGLELIKKSPGMELEKDETTIDILNALKNNKFYLTDDQKSEIRGTYGNLQAYLRTMFGKTKIVKKAPGVSDLGTFWRETLSTLDPGTFAEDTQDLDMPGILAAWLETANKPRYSAEFGQNAGHFATSIGLELMGEYLDMPWTNQRVNALKGQYDRQLKAIREDYAGKYEARVQKASERRKATEKKNSVISQIKQEVRKVRTRVMNATDSRHIPEDLRGAAEAFLHIFDRDNAIFSGYEIQELANKYRLLAENGALHETAAAAMYDPDIEARLGLLTAKMQQSGNLRSMSQAELEMVRDVVNNITHMFEAVNQIRIDGQQRDLEREAGEFMADMRSRKEAGLGPVQRAARLMQYKELTPVYYGKRVGGIVKEIIDDMILNGQNAYAFHVKEFKEFFEKLVKDKKVNQWINSKQHLRFTTVQDDQLELNMQQALTLYAWWQRETRNTLQNAAHLKLGGFTYDLKDKETRKYKGVDLHKAHVLSQADMYQIENYLGEQGKAFADAVVDYLSKTVSEWGNETSMALFGWKKYGEGYYFPYPTDPQFRGKNLAFGSQGQNRKLKNISASHALQENAHNPLKVGSFTDIARNHVNEMAMYNAFAERLDNLERVTNWVDDGSTTLNEDESLKITPPESAKKLMEQAMGAEAVHYLEEFINDVNGGVRSDERGIAGKLFGAFKKSAVAANLSVILQQPSAFARAMSMVSPVYFAKGLNPKDLKGVKSRMYKYSGAAVIKDMGKFDTATGRSAEEWMTDALSNPTKLGAAYDVMDAVTGFGAEKADEVTWCWMYSTIENEVEANTDLEPGTEEFNRAVGQRFDAVMTQTQVYDSTLAKSAWMRSSGGLDKMLTSFMAEPTLTFNMLMDSALDMKEGKKGAAGKAAKTAVVFANAMLVNAILKSIATALRRKKDEGTTLLEKYIAELHGNFFEDVSPTGIASMVPYARDVVSLIQGYSVDRADMNLVEDLIKAFSKVKGQADKDGWESVNADQWVTLGGAALNMFGIPARNVYRDLDGLIGNIFGNRSAKEETTWRDIYYSIRDELGWDWITEWDGANKAYYERMEQALIAGDKAKYEELRGYLEETKQVKPDTVTNGIKSLIKEGVESGQISQEKAAGLLEEYLGVEQGQGKYKAQEWAEKKAHEGDEDWNWSKYNDYYKAVETGENLSAVTKEYLDSGADKETLSKQITSQFKARYVELIKAGKKTEAAELKARLLRAYEVLGYDRTKKAKDIDKWTK